MMLWRRITDGLLIFVFCLTASISWANTYSVSVPLTGDYTQQSAYYLRYCDVDFGRTFATVSSLTASVSGWASPNHIYPIEWGLNVGDEPVPSTNHSQSATASFSSSWDVATYDMFFDISDLLDGRARALIRVSPIWNVGDPPGRLTIYSATLTLDGVAQVPEPASYVFLLSGCFSVVLSRRRW